MRCFERLAAYGAVALVFVAAPAVARAQVEPPVPEPSRFQKVLLEDDLGQTVRFDVAKDGRVIMIQRQGGVRVWDPVAKDTVLAGTVPGTATGETGLIGLALAPDFDATGHIYLNYAMPGFSTTASPNFRRQRTSRFTLSDQNVLDLASEKPIYDSINAGGGGHSGGDLEMTPDGILFITTGDNTNCCAALGWAPLDERPGQAGGDAQRTSGNTNNPNGKLLRIKPLADPGSTIGVGTTYTIPPGNLFDEAQDTENKTLPEIYAMGFRNLFSIGDYDPVTKAIWIGDYGPDAPIDSERGPRGYVRGLLVTEAANYGWPYCTANNLPYADWDFATSTARGVFDCAAPVNDSPNNTGLRNLPPIKPANLYYSYAAQAPWPNLYGGGLHAGPRYVYDASNPSTTKFPEWFNGRRFLLEFTSNFVASLRFGSDLKTPSDVQLFQPTWEFGAPFDARFGADGSLYLLEYGSNSFSSTKLSPALSRIDYVAGNRTPLARAKATPENGPTPLDVEFDASASSDPDGDAISYAWDFDRDGTTDSTAVTVTHRFATAGSYTPRLTVTDANGASSVFNLTVTVGNTAPKVEFLSPVDGTFHEFDKPIPFKIKVTDADGAVDCTKVVVAYSLGHNAHAHPMETVTANASCEGTIQPESDAAHGGTAYLYHVLEASYTDAGGAGIPGLTGTATSILHPHSYTATQNQGQYGTVTASSRYNMATDGAWLMFPHINLRDVKRVNFQVHGQGNPAGPPTGASWTLRVGSPTGPVAARSDNLPATGETFWIFSPVYRYLSAQVTDPGGVHDLYIVIDYPDGTQPGAITLQNFQFITEAPTSVSATVNPAQPNGDNGWYRTAPQVTLTSDQPAAVWPRQISTDNGQTWTSANATTNIATVNAQGSFNLLYRVADNVGVVGATGPTSIPLKIDTVQPAITVTAPTYTQGNPAAPSWTCTDVTSGVASCQATGIDTSTPGTRPFTVTATDNAGNTRSVSSTYTVLTATNTGGDVSGNVPATLSLTLGGAATFGTFTPGVAREYTTSTTANVISTAGDAMLSVADPSTTATGRLMNGAFALPQALQANANGGVYAPVGGSAGPTSLFSYNAPVSNSAVTIGFKQAIGANDALRTGAYSKTLTFTLSTTTP